MPPTPYLQKREGHQAVEQLPPLAPWQTGGNHHGAQQLPLTPYLQQGGGHQAVQELYPLVQGLGCIGQHALPQLPSLPPWAKQSHSKKDSWKESLNMEVMEDVLEFLRGLFLPPFSSDLHPTNLNTGGKKVALFRGDCNPILG